VTESRATVSRSIEVLAPAERVWNLVSDLRGMGEFSPENRGGRWVGAATGPQVGAVFRGQNGRGVRRWSTTSKVVRAVPGQAFAFEVSSLGRPVARWSYEIEPTESGCRLTESWQDRRDRLLVALGAAASGVTDRTAFTEASIEHTLQRVKAAAETARPEPA